MKRLGILAAVVLVAVIAWQILAPASRHSSRDAVDTTGAPAANALRSTEHRDTSLEARLTAIANAAPGRCGISVKHLRTGVVARVNADSAIALLSVVKLPVALAILDGVDQGRWTLTTPCTLIAKDMHPRGWLGDRYPRGGGKVSIYKLVDYMVTRSDNTSADALMRLLGGPGAVTQWLQEHGIHGLRVDRTERGLGNDWYGLPAGADTGGSAEEIREQRAQVPAAIQDSAVLAMLRDPRDTGTADACVQMLDQLWRGDLLSPAMTDTLKSILFRCRTGPHRLPWMLPKGVRVARKTGTAGTWAGVTVAINDIGVMRMPNGDEVAIAVLVGEPRGHVQRAERTIARAARAVYDAWGDDSPEGP